MRSKYFHDYKLPLHFLLFYVNNADHDGDGVFSEKDIKALVEVNYCKLIIIIA